MSGVVLVYPRRSPDSRDVQMVVVVDGDMRVLDVKPRRALEMGRDLIDLALEAMR